VGKSFNFNNDMTKDEFEDYVHGKYSTLPTFRTVSKGGNRSKVRNTIQPRKRIKRRISKKCNNRKTRKNKSRRKYTR
jgi:hypothetical protein